MNILALCNQSEAIQIMKTIKADKYLFICPIKLDQKQLPNNLKIGVNVWAYSHRSMRKGRYFPKMVWKNITPLPGKLVEDMALCESQTMRMIERIKRLRPSLYENRKNYYYNNLRYWNHILTTFKIDVFYRCAPPHEGYDNVISHLCKYYNIAAFYGNPFHTNQGMYRYFAREVKNNFPNFENELNFNQTVNYNDGNIDLIEPLRDLLENHWNKERPKVSPTIIPRKKIKTQKTLLRTQSELLKLYNSKCSIPNLTIPYIYFPLHYQYEATTAPMGGPFVDQYLAVEILSRLGITIYVKEHPRISKNRNVDYYKRLLAMPNVKLISQKSDNYSLIDNSFAVANITGTAGWEALLRGKPSIIFGSIHYQYCYGCYYVDDVESAKKAIESIKTEFKPNKYQLELYLKTLERYLFKHTTIDIISALKGEIDLIKTYSDNT